MSGSVLILAMVLLSMLLVVSSIADVTALVVSVSMGIHADWMAIFGVFLVVPI